MPELTGRSLEQIEAQLRDGRFKPDDFAKRPSEPAAGASSVTAAA
jgi:glutamate formiminotransferase